MLIASLTILAFPIHSSVSINSADHYWLSAEELLQLKNQAIGSGDGYAAFRVALYYGGNRLDNEHYMLWLQKAADLGNESARNHIKYLDKQRAGIDTEMKHSQDQEVGVGKKQGSGNGS